MSVFTPLHLNNGTTLPNRIAKAAMEENMADADHAPSAALIRLYQAWAQGGASRDFETAQLMGIKINNVISFTFAVGSFLAAIGSMMYFSNYTAVTPTVGAMPGLKAFVAAVFGGIGSIPGAVIGGFIIGICESLIKGAGATTFSDAFTFALLIVVLAVKPTGLFSENLTEKV